MNNETKPVKSKFKISNEVLNEIYFNMPVNDGRCLRLFLKNLYNTDIEPGVFYNITDASFSKMTGADIRDARKLLEGMVEGFRELPALTIRTETTVMAISWFSKCIYNKEKHIFSVKFHEDIIPYIKELSGNFSQIPLQICLEYSSSRHIALTEWLYSNKFKKNKEGLSEVLIELEDFYSLFSVPEASRTYKILKRNVLKPYMERFKESSVGTSIKVVDSGFCCRKGSRVHSIKFIYSF